METGRGEFVQDAAGLYHYDYTQFGTVDMAAEDALKHRPVGSAAWFWFNGTFAPIQPEDSVNSLVARWSEWRESYQKDPKLLLAQLHGYSKTTT